jgi:hypothetical protein
MASSKNTVGIGTCLDRELWVKAQYAGVEWSTALKMGVEALLGINQHVTKLREQRDELRFKLRAIEEQLAKEEAKLEQNEERERSILELVRGSHKVTSRDCIEGKITSVTSEVPNMTVLAACAARVKNKPALVRHLLAEWNKTTGAAWDEATLLDVCRRFERGEFNVPSAQGGSLANQESGRPMKLVGTAKPANDGDKEASNV